MASASSLRHVLRSPCRTACGSRLRIRYRTARADVYPRSRQRPERRQLIRQSSLTCAINKTAYCPKFLMTEIRTAAQDRIRKNLARFATENFAEARPQHVIFSRHAFAHARLAIPLFRRLALDARSAKAAMVRARFSPNSIGPFRMIFASDNWAGAHPNIAAGLVTPAAGFRPPMATAISTSAVYAGFSEIFEREVAVFFVAHRHGRQLAVADRSATAGRRLLLPSRSAYHRGRMRRAGIFHRRRAALCRSTARWARIDPDDLEQADRALRAEFVHSGPADGGLDHPGDRDRHGL